MSPVRSVTYVSSRTINGYEDLHPKIVSWALSHPDDLKMIRDSYVAEVFGAILNAKKDIENRTWRTKIRGAVAVHASQTMRQPEYEEALQKIKTVSPRVMVPPYESMSRGAIIGVVDIVGCESKTKSKWHARGHYGFILANPRALRGQFHAKAP